MFEIEETKKAVKDKKKVKSMSNTIKKRFQDIFYLLQTDPYSVQFGGENLMYEGEGLRSFELTKKDRIVIEIVEELNTVLVYQYLGHYTDK
ncbi:MAG: Txe/YoeB family addiction module toxin [Sphingobacteriia bacterium]|jgi:toxin YoeB|nr:hypothetical protein [Paludibacteraceae bacterium]NCA79068.1 Txe/YoeB family addiction module toxin [Sphingobacteriia bacterium]